MCDPSGLKFLWKHENYDLKSFISDGRFIQYIVFEDKRKCQQVLGKIITSPGEGEAYHWPRLQHENLIPLLDVVSINETKSVYMFPFIGKTIGNTIHDFNFLYDSECFNRKKAYAEDILWALDYLHGKSLCLLNLTELIIYVCNASDKAVICDFSCVFLIERATKDKIQLPTFYQAPEIHTEDFEPIAAETWACGVMLLQIFTRHKLPSAFVGDEVHQVVQAVTEINYDLIKEANPGCQLRASDVTNLKKFLDSFLVRNPKKRINVQLAAVSSFLRRPRRFNVSDRNFREQLMESKANETRYFQVRENRNNNEYKDSAYFKEIYLEEAAKYRNKLKQVPRTNKFINLDVVPKYDDTTKSHENQNCTYRTSSKTNRVAETDSTDVRLPSDIDSEELVIGDIQEVTSELFENDLPTEFLHDIRNSKLGEKSESFGDVTGGNSHQSMDEYLRYSYLDEHFSDISINSYGEDFVIRDILLDYEKQFELKSHSIPSSISTDSLESNAEINLNTVSKLNDSDSSLQKIGIFPCGKLENKRSKFPFPQKKIHYFSETIQTKSDRKSESNLGNISVKYKKDLIPSKSDSCIANRSDAKNKSDEFNFVDKKFLGAYSNSSTSKQILLFDSTKLNKISDDNIAGYTWQSYGIIKKPLQVPQAKSDLYNKCTATHLTTAECSQSTDNHHSNHNGYQLIKNNSAKSIKLCNGENKNLEEHYLTTVDNMKDNEVILRLTDCSQCKGTINDCLNPKNSYEEAMSQQQTNVTQSKSMNNTNNLLSKLRRFKMSPFTISIRKSKCNSKKQSNCSCLSKDYKYPREDELAGEQNPATSLEHTSLNMDSFLLNNKQDKYRKQEKSKKMRNKWIQYLCPGSRTCLNRNYRSQ